MQYSTVNESHYGKASMTSHEGKEVTGSVQCCAVNKSNYNKANKTGHEEK